MRLVERRAEDREAGERDAEPRDARVELRGVARCLHLVGRGLAEVGEELELLAEMAAQPLQRAPALQGAHEEEDERREHRHGGGCQSRVDHRVPHAWIVTAGGAVLELILKRRGVEQPGSSPGS